MADSLSRSPSTKNAVFALIAFVLAFDLAFVGQKLGGAYQSEFGGAPKEAAHYMAGLFWRDLAVSLWRDRAEGKHESLSEEKKSFTQEWGTHYPSLQTGVERSLFHGLEGAWMLALPATRGALLVLMAALAGILATQLFRAVQPDYGWIGGGVAAAGLMALPAMREYAGVVGPDILSAILLFGAAMTFGNFIDREKGMSAWLAGIFGGLAILNSGSRGDLWFVFLVVFIPARKYGLLRRPAVWGMIVLIIAASLIRADLNGGSYVYSKETVQSYASHFVGTVGLGGFALIVLGFFLKLRRGGEHFGRWMAAGALLLDSVTSRDFFWALPAALMFAVAGGAWMAQWVGARPMWGGKGARARISFAAILTALALFSVTGSWKKKEPCTGFAPLAEMLITDASPDDVTLVSSDPEGEERFMAELAMREPQRPGHKVLYGTQILAIPGKKFLGAETVFPSDEAVFSFLTSGKIKYVALDDAVPDEARREHHYQIRRAIEEHLTRFWVIATCPVTRDGVIEAKPAKLYKIKGAN